MSRCHENRAVWAAVNDCFPGGARNKTSTVGTSTRVRVPWEDLLNVASEGAHPAGGRKDGGWFWLFGIGGILAEESIRLDVPGAWMIGKGEVKVLIHSHTNHN